MLETLIIAFNTGCTSAPAKGNSLTYILWIPASWTPSVKASGGAPQLKGARWFSYVELKKCTNNFSGNNEIGSGGYGKVKISKIFVMINEN